MAKLLMLCSAILKSFICLLLLATTLATSARILDQVTPQIPFPANPTEISDPIAPPETAIPEVAQPAAATSSTTTNVAPIIPPTEPFPVIAPVPDIPDVAAPPAAATTTTIPTTTTVAEPIIPPAEPSPIIAPPITAPAATTPSTGAATAASTTTTGGTTNSGISGGHPALSFFMHDILGGSHPSGRVVTGIVTNSNANNLPFSKPNNQIFPINGGVPLNTINSAINNNNYPSLIGLNGNSQTNTLIQNNGNNVVAGNNNQAFVTAGQLPAGLTLQQLMFGSVTVVDNEITSGHELGSNVLGRAQGFYLTSSSDGSSHTLVLTAVFHGGDRDEILDTVSFFGIHRTATPISHIAIVGGTGKYENAKGYATIETLPHEDQHTTDGLETITNFTLYIAA